MDYHIKDVRHIGHTAYHRRIDPAARSAPRGRGRIKGRDTMRKALIGLAMFVTGTGLAIGQTPYAPVPPSTPSPGANAGYTDAGPANAAINAAPCTTCQPQGC